MWGRISSIRSGIGNVLSDFTKELAGQGFEEGDKLQNQQDGHVDVAAPQSIPPQPPSHHSSSVEVPIFPAPAPISSSSSPPSVVSPSEDSLDNSFTAIDLSATTPSKPHHHSNIDYIPTTPSPYLGLYTDLKARYDRSESEHQIEVSHLKQRIRDLQDSLDSSEEQNILITSEYRKLLSEKETEIKALTLSRDELSRTNESLQTQLQETNSRLLSSPPPPTQPPVASVASASLIQEMDSLRSKNEELQKALANILTVLHQQQQRVQSEWMSSEMNIESLDSSSSHPHHVPPTPSSPSAPDSSDVESLLAQSASFLASSSSFNPFYSSLKPKQQNNQRTISSSSAAVAAAEGNSDDPLQLDQLLSSSSASQIIIDGNSNSAEDEEEEKQFVSALIKAEQKGEIGDILRLLSLRLQTANASAPSSASRFISSTISERRKQITNVLDSVHSKWTKANEALSTQQSNVWSAFVEVEETSKRLFAAAAELHRASGAGDPSSSPTPVSAYSGFPAIPNADPLAYIVCYSSTLLIPMDRIESTRSLLQNTQSTLLSASARIAATTRNAEAAVASAKSLQQKMSADITRIQELESKLTENEKQIQNVKILENRLRALGDVLPAPASAAASAAATSVPGDDIVLRARLMANQLERMLTVLSKLINVCLRYSLLPSEAGKPAAQITADFVVRLIATRPQLADDVNGSLSKLMEESKRAAETTELNTMLMKKLESTQVQIKGLIDSSDERERSVAKKEVGLERELRETKKRYNDLEQQFEQMQGMLADAQGENALVQALRKRCEDLQIAVNEHSISKASWARERTMLEVQIREFSAKQKEEMDEMHRTLEISEEEVANVREESARNNKMLDEMKRQLSEADKRFARIQTELEEAQDRTERVTEDSDLRIRDLQTRLDIKTEELNKSTQSAMNLQRVLEAIQADQEVQIQTRIHSSKQEMESLRRELENVKKEAANASGFKEEIRIMEERRTVLERELVEKQKFCTSLQVQNQSLRKAVEESVSRITSSNDDSVQRETIKKLVLTFLTGKSRTEVLELLSRILKFTEDDKILVGIKKKPTTPSTGGGGLLSSLLGGFGSRRASGSGTPTSSLSPSASLTSPAGPSLSELWVEFLMKEVDSEQQSVASPQDRAPSPSTIVNISALQRK